MIYHDHPYGHPSDHDGYYWPCIPSLYLCGRFYPREGSKMIKLIDTDIITDEMREAFFVTKNMKINACIKAAMNAAPDYAQINDVVWHSRSYGGCNLISKVRGHNPINVAYERQKHLIYSAQIALNNLIEGFKEP